MESDAEGAYSGSIDVAELQAWPVRAEEHTAILQNIRPNEWRTVPRSFLDLVTEAGYWPIAFYDLNTRYGERQFNVWRAFGEHRVLVVKEVKATALMVTCTLGVTDGQIEATFALLSGWEFYTKLFGVEATSVEAPLYFKELEHVAFEEALEQGIVESASQPVQVVLAGFDAALPSGVRLWSGGALTPRSLEARLERLRVSTASEQDALPNEVEETASLDEQATLEPEDECSDGAPVTDMDPDYC